MGVFLSVCLIADELPLVGIDVVEVSPPRDGTT
jgi:arginase family enzyme